MKRTTQFLANLKKAFPVCLVCCRTMLLIGFCGVIIFLFLQLLLPRLIQIDQYRDEVVATLHYYTGRKVEIGALGLDLRKGIAIECINAAIFEKNEKDVFVRAQKIYLVLKLIPLFKKQIAIDKIVLQAPNLQLIRRKDGTLNFQDLIDSVNQKLRKMDFDSFSKDPFNRKKLQNLENAHFLIYEGNAKWRDHKAKSRKATSLNLEHLNFVVPSLSLDSKIPFRLTFETPFRQKSNYFELHGHIIHIPENFDLAKVMIDARVRMRATTLGLLLPYYRKFLPYRNLTGRFSLKGHYFGNLMGHFKSKGSMVFQNLRLDYPRLFKKNIKASNGALSYSLSLDEKRFKLVSADLQFDDMHIKGNGSIEDIWDPQKAKVHFDFYSDRIPILTGKQFVPVKVIKQPQFEEFFVKDMIGGSTIKTTMHFRGHVQDWNIKGFRKNLDLFSFRADVDHIQVDLNPEDLDPTRRVEPLVFKSGRVLLEKGKMSFIDMSATWGKSTLNEGYGTIIDLFNKKAFMKLWIDANLAWRHTTSFLAYDIFNILPKVRALEGQGVLAGKLDLKIPLRRPREFTLDGVVKGKDVAFNSPRLQLRFSDINEQITFKGITIEIPKTNLKLGDSAISLEGKFQDYFSPKIEAKIESEDFNFQNLIGSRLIDQFSSETHTESESETAESTVENWQAQIPVYIKKGVFKKLAFTEMKTDLEINKGFMLLNNFQFDACDGSFRAHLMRVDLHPENRGDFNLIGNFDNYELGCLFDPIRPRNVSGKVMGHANTNLRLSSNLTHQKRLLRELNGEFKIHAENGSLVEMKTLANVMRILNMRFLDPRLKSFEYHRARADFKIKDGVAETNNFYVDGKAGSLTSVGKFDLSELTIDGYLGMHLYDNIDKMLGAIPIIGNVMKGRDGKILTLYFRVKGKLEDPTVTPTPFHSLRKGISKLLLGIFR